MKSTVLLGSNIFQSSCECKQNNNDCSYFDFSYSIGGNYAVRLFVLYRSVSPDHIVNETKPNTFFANKSEIEWIKEKYNTTKNCIPNQRKSNQIDLKTVVGRIVVKSLNHAGRPPVIHRYRRWVCVWLCPKTIEHYRVCV